MNEQSIIYRINSRDEIVFVNDLWEQVVSANNNLHLLRPNILGRNIWEYISDYSTRELYKDLVKNIRSGGPARFNFRCDTPQERRLMEMRIIPRKNELIQFESEIIRVEERQFQRLFDINALRSDEILNVCGWCKKINIEMDIWSEVEEALTIMGIFENEKLPNISHGICHECYGPWVKELDAAN